MKNFDTRLPSSTCTLIDGEKIRRIRQNQGVTQLYVATALGVTTETVSRWENNRSPSIKRENAEKLAEVLAVDLSEVCYIDNEVCNNPHEEQELTGGSGAETSFSVFRRRSDFGVLLLVVLVLMLGLFIGRYFVGKQKPIPGIDISSYRILPSQVSLHQSFPVIIVVDSKQDFIGSFILRESFPASLSVQKGIPLFQVFNEKQGKWIAVGDTGVQQFGYLATVTGKGKEGDQLHFSGNLLVGKKEIPVSGSTRLQIQNYHWADANADYTIDDNEILAIYSYFELLQTLGVDINEIQRIWAGNGYRWDQESGKFIVTIQRKAGSTP